MATIAEKYAQFKNKTIEQMTLDIVESIISKHNPKSGGVEIICGWWQTANEPKEEEPNNICPFNMMAGECYHQEINKIMTEQGFHVYENLGDYRRRPYTIYRL